MTPLVLSQLQAAEPARLIDRRKRFAVKVAFVTGGVAHPTDLIVLSCLAVTIRNCLLRQGPRAAICAPR
jgi:hypothetical protein